MDTNENEKQEINEFPIDATKVTTEYTHPVGNGGKQFYEAANNIDTSEEAIAKSPTIIGLTQLGKRTTDNYLEQQRRNSRAGKFAAWSQFANALASFIGGAANGQAMPIQQNYNLPMTSFQKADAYRDAVAQNEEKYKSMEINAKQNELNRRLSERSHLMEMGQKADEDAYRYGAKVKTESNPIDDEYKLAGIRQKNAMAGYYNKRSENSGKVEKLQELTVVDQFTNSIDVPEWLRGRRTYGQMYPEFQRRIEAIKEKANSKPVSQRNELERYLTSTDGNELKYDANLLKLDINPSQISQKDKNWFHKIIMMDPESFKDILTDDSYGFRRTTLTGVDNSDNENGFSEEDTNIAKGIL